MIINCACLFYYCRHWVLVQDTDQVYHVDKSIYPNCININTWKKRHISLVIVISIWKWMFQVPVEYQKFIWSVHHFTNPNNPVVIFPTVAIADWGRWIVFTVCFCVLLTEQEEKIPRKMHRLFNQHDKCLINVIKEIQLKTQISFIDRTNAE
jgi:hypothetical protein